MGHIFRINKVDGHTSTTIVDWSSTTRSTYDHGFVDKIVERKNLKDVLHQIIALH